MSLKKDLPLIGEQIAQAAGEKFTGKLQISMHMNQGGITRINVLKETDLKRFPEKEKKVWREDDD
jgi:uncharacterized protein with FMN-binding domain